LLKIKILNPTAGKNRASFIGFLQMQNFLFDHGIELTESGDYDYLFVGHYEFANKGLSIEDSIDYGLNNLSKITGDYIIFDGSDSTSLMGSYEILSQSNALYLFKNSLLKNKDLYKKPSANNKWFFGEGSTLDKGYDIPQKEWDRIKTSRYNLGYTMANGVFRPQNQRLVQPLLNKSEDVCAVYRISMPENYEHKARNDEFYMHHRQGALSELNKIKSKYRIHTEKIQYQQYVKILQNSKLALSPFGMGEACHRDFELMEFGTAMIKPDMSMIETSPDYYVDGETYFSVKLDWSNLNEVVEKLLSEPDRIEYVARNAQQKYLELYNPNIFCSFWHNFLSNL
jgi:hypothetical protein